VNAAENNRCKIGQQISHRKVLKVLRLLLSASYSLRSTNFTGEMLEPVMTNGYHDEKICLQKNNEKNGDARSIQKKSDHIKELVYLCAGCGGVGCWERPCLHKVKSKDKGNKKKATQTYKILYYSCGCGGAAANVSTLSLQSSPW
jgi:hypothetical protein